VTGVAAPQRDLDRVDDAQQRFVAAVTELDDAGLRRASHLPGWSTAHVVAHVARNADSHRRRADAAARGEVIDQYPGGFAGRAAEIEQSAARDRAELIDDLVTSAAQLAVAWRAVPPDAWDAISRDVSGRERALRELPGRRWQELEVHLVDLDAGVTPRDWPADFVAAALPTLRGTVASRLPAGATLPAPGMLDDRDELAWLYGRLDRPELPALAPWG
jgi:maleylpyruvate isomerase